MSNLCELGDVNLIEIFFKIYLIYVVISSNIVGIQGKYLDENYPKEAIEDARLDTAELIAKYKYPVETHYVTTDDNYILRVHRIPNPGAPPIFLMHGLLDSSATWVLMGPNQAPAYYFYDKGFDVWMGNARGNRYSRNHTTLNPNNDRTFWTFSWHEIGFYDLASMIDYVLQETSFNKTGYVGHSQGTTAFWVLCSMRPEYNEKISVMQALAPVAFMKHVKSPLEKGFSEFVKASKDSIGEFLPYNKMMLSLCFMSKLSESICVDFFHQLLGNDGEQTNSTMFPTIVGHVPAGCNLKQFGHYLQLVKNDRFCQYDYGSKENMLHYNQSSPPDYPLKKISVPVGLHYCYNDNLSSTVDVKRLAAILPNVVDNVLYPQKRWNHVSMLWGIDSRKLVQEPILEVFKKYTA